MYRTMVADTGGVTTGDAELTSVGYWFLAEYAGITSLDLTPLAHLTSVTIGFLCDCSALT